MTFDDPVLEALLDYVRENGRVCPTPTIWDQFWRSLPDRSLPGGSYCPKRPLILGAWDVTSALEKQIRLREHILHAYEKGVLDQADEFLRSLPEDSWAHLGDF